MHLLNIRLKYTCYWYAVDSLEFNENLYLVGNYNCYLIWK